MTYTLEDPAHTRREYNTQIRRTTVQTRFSNDIPRQYDEYIYAHAPGTFLRLSGWLPVRPPALGGVVARRRGGAVARRRDGAVARRRGGVDARAGSSAWSAPA